VAHRFNMGRPPLLRARAKARGARFFTSLHVRRSLRPARRSSGCLPPIADVARSWFAVEPILRKGDTPLRWLFRADRPLRVLSLGRWGPVNRRSRGASAAAVSEIRQHPRKRVVALSPVGADAAGSGANGSISASQRLIFRPQASSSSPPSLTALGHQETAAGLCRRSTKDREGQFELRHDRSDEVNSRAERRATSEPMPTGPVRGLASPLRCLMIAIFRTDDQTHFPG